MRTTRRRQVRGAILLAIASIGVVSVLHQTDADAAGNGRSGDRKSTRLNSSHT